MKYVFTFLLCCFLCPTTNGQNSENWSIEIPEVQELIFVIFTITEVGLKDSIMIDHNSDYYKNVLHIFGKYREEKIVKRIGRKIERFYDQIRMDASNYHFNETDDLVRNRTINNLSWGKHDYIKKYISSLEEFSQKTNFRTFYNSNKPYYDSLRALLEIQAPITKQWDWLERNFDINYNRIGVFFSPLCRGRHSANRLEVNSEKHIVIFTSDPYENKNLSPAILEAENTRMLFTEIDHNYVNPTSDLFLNEIISAFKDREKWTDGKFSNDYKSEYSVFNEYMTWALFTLYALDHFNEQDYSLIKNNLEEFMVDYRGFSKFEEFNNKMVELYQNKKATTQISELYPFILDWCKNI